MVIDRRYLIEETLDDVKQEVVDLLERLKRERPELQLRAARPLDSPADHDRARRAGGHGGRARHRRGASAASPDYVVSPGTYDQKHIDRIGRLHDCIAYGPGILDLAHQPDEWVGIDDMVRFGQGDGARR